MLRREGQLKGSLIGRWVVRDTAVEEWFEAFRNAAAGMSSGGAKAGASRR
jgi:hypothetical protein